MNMRSWYKGSTSEKNLLRTKIQGKRQQVGTGNSNRRVTICCPIFWTQLCMSLPTSLRIWKWKWICSVLSHSLRPHGLQPTSLLHPWDFPGKSTGVGCHFLLQGIFPTQWLNLGLPYCRQVLYHLSHQGIYLWLKKEWKCNQCFKISITWTYSVS